MSQILKFQAYQELTKPIYEHLFFNKKEKKEKRKKKSRDSKSKHTYPIEQFL